MNEKHGSEKTSISVFVGRSGRSFQTHSMRFFARYQPPYSFTITFSVHAKDDILSQLWIKAVKVLPCIANTLNRKRKSKRKESKKKENRKRQRKRLPSPPGSRFQSSIPRRRLTHDSQSSHGDNRRKNKWNTRSGNQTTRVQACIAPAHTLAPARTHGVEWTS